MQPPEISCLRLVVPTQKSAGSRSTSPLQSQKDALQKPSRTYGSSNLIKCGCKQRRGHALRVPRSAPLIQQRDLQQPRQLISILLLFTATVNAAISHPVLYSQPLEGEKKYISRENPPTHSFVTTVKWTTIHLFCKLTMQSKNVNTHVHSLSNSPKVFHMIPLILDHSSAFIIWHHTDGTIIIYHSNDLCR